VVADGQVYVVGAYSILYALDATTGDVRWTYNPFDPYNFGDTSPAVANGLVYVAAYTPKPREQVEGSVTAVDASTGQQRFVIGFYEEIRTTPAVGEGVLTFPSFYHRHLYAADATSGAVWWARWMRRTWILPTPTVANGVVYEGDTRRLWALDARTGAVIRKNWFGAGECVVANGVIYVSGTDGYIHALSEMNLREVWRTAGGGSLVVANGMLYDGSGAFALP
jgi:outer membrane protein assembly factor BamB